MVKPQSRQGVFDIKGKSPFCGLPSALRNGKGRYSLLILWKKKNCTDGRRRSEGEFHGEKEEKGTFCCRKVETMRKRKNSSVSATGIFPRLPCPGTGLPCLSPSELQVLRRKAHGLSSLSPMPLRDAGPDCDVAGREGKAAFASVCGGNDGAMRGAGAGLKKPGRFPACRGLPENGPKNVSSSGRGRMLLVRSAFAGHGGAWLRPRFRVVSKSS